MPISIKDIKDLAPATPQVAASAVSAEVHPADPSYAPPVSTVQLPSRGMTYPPESPLYRCESVDIKSVTAKEEDILSSQALIKKGVVLSTLMRACITNRLIDPDQMLVGDRNAVLIAIRVSAYGPEYACGVVCPECADSCEHSFDLSKLTLKRLDEVPTGGPGSNEFSFTLPVSKKQVFFRLMNSSEVNKLDEDTEAMRKRGQDKSVTMRLMAQITRIIGVEQAHLPRAIGDLPARDSRALRAYMDEVAPGVDMVQDFKCPACGKVTEVDIPIGTEFFWPAKV